METKANERSELAGLVLLSSVGRQRGRAKLSEQQSWCFSERFPRELCAKWGPGGRQGGSKRSSYREKGSRGCRLGARRSTLNARGSRLDAPHWLLSERAAGVLGAVVAASGRRKWVVPGSEFQFAGRPLGGGGAPDSPATLKAGRE